MKVVAEIGLNHCGSEERCIDLVQDILNTCVDAVTFQIREKSFYDHSHPRKRELSDTFYVEISETIKNSGKEVGFAITRPDKVRILPADFWKTLSWDLCNYELLNLLSTTKKNVYASTGMASLDQIIDVSSTISCVEFIHTQLDTEISGVNLKAIDTIQQATRKPCGFGLHCEMLEVLYSSISFKPSSIFFYVKDETGLENPDDDWAITISKVDEITRNLRKLLLALGDGVKDFKENLLHPKDDNITSNVIK